MTTAQAIAETVSKMPEAAQQEVLDFVEFLESRLNRESDHNEEADWVEFSVASAMRGMEDEPSYSTEDLKDSFR